LKKVGDSVPKKVNRIIKKKKMKRKGVAYSMRGTTINRFGI